jgi:pimeloyl-ACP methyl ester carboxylesterase
VERRLVVLAASALIVAAVLSSAWVTGQFTTPAVDRTDGYVGELAARDQPWTRLFRATEVLAGLACLLGVALLPRMRRQWPGWLAMAGFGAFTAVGGLFPYDCATFSVPGCARGAPSLSHHVHAVSCVLAVAAVLVAMVLLTLSWHAWGAALLTGASLGVAPLVPAAAVAGAGAGALQRAQLLLIAAWLVYVALRLLVAEAPARRHRRQHVVAQGAGPAVLVSPGPAGAWFHWDRVAALLVDRHRVIRFDRPGLGFSAASPLPPTLYGEAARLAALAPAHPERVTVVAGSVAAWHAEAFARLHPLRVSGLVLVNPACARSARRTSALGRELGHWLPALGRTWGAAALARLAGPAGHRLLTGITDVRRVYARGRVPAAIAGEWLARRDMAADLRRIRDEHPLPDVPVTVISSGRLGRCRRRLARVLDAKLVHLPRCGRRVHLEDPGAIADAV